MPAEVGQKAPDFSMPNQAGETVTLNQFKGKKNVVLSFHVFDFTGGWSNQVSSFHQQRAGFEEKGAQVLGISCDSQHSHRAWSNAMGNIGYPILSDFHPKGKMIRDYGLWNEERGASFRAVIIVDKDGVVRYRNVLRQGLPNISEVLAEVSKLS